MQRRSFIGRAGLLALGAYGLRSTAAALPLTDDGIALAAGPRVLVSYPGKRPLIRVTTRPPHLETPFEVFDHGPITPNDAFFVRYHLANLPLSIDESAFRLSVTGSVARPLRLSLSDLKTQGDSTEVVAVNQCSGNSRGYLSPRVFGAQLGDGAMGNARWLGVPLRTVLQKAGVLAAARTVVFNGLDEPVLPATSDFRKSLDIERALSPDTLLAWEMNGAPLPFLNGYPLRLVVPGYFGTYWVKHLSEITVLDHDLEGHDAFFMTTAYRIPDNDCICVAPGRTPEKTPPIGRLPVRSFMTNVRDGDTIRKDQRFELRGIAFDGGSGVQSVDVSTDSGRTWLPANLKSDLGRFSFRSWSHDVRFEQPGNRVLMVRARNRDGEAQPSTADWNPGGYGRHVIESYRVAVI